MFSRTSIGIACGTTGIAVARLGGRKTAPCVQNVSFRPIPPGTLSVSFRERNIQNEPVFRESLREACNSLSCKADRVYLSLPDAMGHVLLLDIEERLRNRPEALEILRWKLKKKVPFDISEAHLDYQNIATRDTGETVVLVALADRSIIRQYEDVASSAGMTAVAVDLNCFSTCRLFTRSLPMDEEYALISYFENMQSVTHFSKGTLQFIRTRRIEPNEAEASQFRRELKNSALAYRDRFPERSPGTIFCAIPPEAASDFLGITGEIFDCDPIPVETEAGIRTADTVSSGGKNLFRYSSSIGAALRGI